MAEAWPDFIFCTAGSIIPKLYKMFRI